VSEAVPKDGHAVTGEDATRITEVVGVFGGSFDPPHVAHVMAAAYALSATEIDRLVVIPTYRHPFAKPLAPYEHRLRMCELAMADLRRVEVSRIEAELGGDSWTVRTLEELRRREPYARLRLVIGSDLLKEAPRWHAFDRISAIAPPLVIGRAGYPSEQAMRADLPAVSSTEIRKRLAEGVPVEGLVPRVVIDYVRAHGLYR